jgi:hypothetical protein
MLTAQASSLKMIQAQLDLPQVANVNKILDFCPTADSLTRLLLLQDKGTNVSLKVVASAAVRYRMKKKKRNPTIAHQRLRGKEA